MLNVGVFQGAGAGADLVGGERLRVGRAGGRGDLAHAQHRPHDLAAGLQCRGKERAAG